MSLNLYVVRVFFDTDHGFIKAPGVYRAITKSPNIPGLPKLTMIDFTPQVNVALLLPWAGEKREMTSPEALAVVAWIKTVQAGTDA